MSSTHREWIKGSLDLMLLALLEPGPMYGYQMVKDVQRRSGDLLQLKEGSVYPALHRLEQQGLIEGFWQQRVDGANRRYYRITAHGQAVLPERRADWQQFVQAVMGVLHHADT